MKISQTSSTGAVIPVNVVAFCVSPYDAQSMTGLATYFAGTTVHFERQTSDTCPAYLGANIYRDLSQPPLLQLETGVHLHWALPDALTNASVDKTNKIQFPAVPNRWLVTRIQVTGATLTSADVISWVIESDTLTLKPTVSPHQPNVPIIPGSVDANDHQQDYAYLGRSIPLKTYAPSALLHNSSTFRAATGNHLTAVSNGTPGFAAYYPEARGAFGFVDSLTDISGAASLMYVVTGWFDDPENDPARLSLDLASSHAWKVATSPDYTLYSGFVQSIAWDAQRNYIYNNTPGPIIAQAALANTPMEASSTYLRAQHYPQVPLIEQLLTGFQKGVLPHLTQQALSLQAQLAETTHNTQFQAYNASLIYDIVAKDISGNERNAPALPFSLSSALNQLNIAARAYAEVSAHLESFAWKMFADWYRYFLSTDEEADSIHSNASLIYSGGEWDTVYAAWQDADNALKAQLATLNTLLSSFNNTATIPFELQTIPGQGYWQPTDPTILLAGDDLKFPSRYGGDAKSGINGQLPGRSTDQLISALTVNATQINGTQFSSALSLPSDKLPYTRDCTNLLIEACLLNTRMAASAAKTDELTLATALRALLNAQSQNVWTITLGLPPSPVALTWWGPENPWLPLFLNWTVRFRPLQATNEGDDLVNYSPDFFNANFTIDPQTGSFIRYTPEAGQGGINVDPRTIDFTQAQTYSGQSILSPTSIDNLSKTLTEYEQKTGDTSLHNLIDTLKETPVTVQSLSGLTAGFMMQALIPQLHIAVSSGADEEAITITEWTTDVIQRVAKALDPHYNTLDNPVYHFSPLNASENRYNPVRAGWFTLEMEVIDVFGQRRPVNCNSFSIAESMTAYDNNKQAVPNVAYAAPRLAQPARLLFEWMSASADGLKHCSEHPVINPICGWLLPNHLNEGFSLYNTAGHPLGTLQLNGDKSAVVWQSAPGDDATINQPIEEVLANTHPAFKALALKLAKPDSGSDAAQWFKSFWLAIDKMQNSISPDLLTTNAGLSVLIGQPLAVTQAILRLDMYGRTPLNQSRLCNESDSFSDYTWNDTDNGFSSVQYPVLLGNTDDLNDGLAGYFLPADDGYDLTTFYCAGAAQNAKADVVQPSQNTILLKPTPTFDAPEPDDLTQQALPLLLLVDPRAPVHATTGILPTQSCHLPPNLAADALSALEMSFPVMPVLTPSEDNLITMPVPREAGYAISFVEQEIINGKTAWTTYPDITCSVNTDATDYRQQRLTEGWLRLNPVVLSFMLVNNDGSRALVNSGPQSQILKLRITNKTPSVTTFWPSKPPLVTEGTPPPSLLPDQDNGSIFYIHFDTLVDQKDIPAIGLSADGWSFQCLNDQRYGNYWAASPHLIPQPLQPGKYIDITLTNLKVISGAVSAHLSTDYYGVTGAIDGVFTDLVTINQLTPTSLS